MIIVDQLPMYRVTELGKDMDRKGFRSLYSNGVVFENALYNHANTSTAPGHASISTGATPSVHGIVSNFWLNQESMRRVLSTTDSNSYILGLDKVRSGSTPRQLEAITFADRLIEHSSGNSKVYSVSMKDRGAIFMAGMHGKAFWYNNAIGKFVTSDYYYDEDTLPMWLTNYNEVMYEGVPVAWQVLMNNRHYKFASQDMRSYERPPRGWEKTFPHTYSEPGDREYYRQVYVSPYADVLNIGLAKRIIEEESLGEDAHTDLLSISLSASDTIGHSFGPNSLEAEDNSFRLDRLLGRFIDYLENRYNEDEFLLVLTSDHGVYPIPETQLEPGQELTRVNSGQLASELNRHIKEQLNYSNDLVTHILLPSIYFDTSTIIERELDIDKINAISIQWLEARAEINRAFIVSNLDQCHIKDDICKMVSNNIYPGRSGEIYLVQAKNTIFGFDPPILAANHGSPYKQDRHVPVIFYGMNLQAEHVGRQIEPNAITPTLASLLGLKPLDSSLAPLPEIMRQ